MAGEDTPNPHTHSHIHTCAELPVPSLHSQPKLAARVTFPRGEAGLEGERHCLWEGGEGRGGGKERRSGSGGAGAAAHLDMCSLWGRCAFSSPSLVKMPTSTMTATTPQMM